MVPIPALGGILLSSDLSFFISLLPRSLQYSKHLFVHIGQTNPSYSDPLLEAVDIRQIYDKFPEKKGGLKELYERGPQNSFFLVKFWVRCWEDEDGEGCPRATGSLQVGHPAGRAGPSCAAP